MQFLRSIMNPPTSNEGVLPSREATRPAPRSGSKRGLKERRPPEIAAAEDEPRLPGIGTMARTRRLIMAALRVWELKRGIRE